jgi:hypothetical protein
MVEILKSRREATGRSSAARRRTNSIPWATRDLQTIHPDPISIFVSKDGTDDLLTEPRIVTSSQVVKSAGCHHNPVP